MPGRVLFLEEEVGDGSAKVTAQGGHSFGLARAVLLHELEGLAQDGGRLLGLKDGDEIAVDGAALADALVPREGIRHAIGVPDVAQLREQAALFGGVKMDNGQGRTQPTAPIVDDQ